MDVSRPTSRLMAVARLRMSRIRYYGQLETHDCGVACLSMALDFLGRPVGYRELRGVVKLGANGATAAAIIHAAESFGFAATAVCATSDALRAMARGAILHCRLGHYVVFDGVERDGTVRILDPRRGRRSIRAADCDGVLSGIGIVLRPTSRCSHDGRSRWSAVQAAAQRAGPCSRHVLPGALLWGLVHLASLGTVAGLIGVMGSPMPLIVRVLIGCAALASCEAVRAGAIRRRCTKARLCGIRTELIALLQAAEGDRPVAQRAAYVHMRLAATVDIVDRTVNVCHHATCAALTFVALSFTNPVAWLGALVFGAAFATESVRSALRRVDTGGELSALDADRAQTVADLLRAANIAAAAQRYEHAYRQLDRLINRSEAIGRMWMLTAVLVAAGSIAVESPRGNGQTLAAPMMTLLLSVSIVLSVQRAITAGVRLVALPERQEHDSGRPL